MSEPEGTHSDWWGPFKRIARRLNAWSSIPSRRSRSWLRYLDHVEEDGCALYRLACERNVEGIVAKHRDGLYDTRKPLWVCS
jgi:ATP-dependent DNA ligase